MKKIKITHPYGNWPLSRQIPGGGNVWGDYQFHINEDIEECDFWFILDDLPEKDSVKCLHENIVLIALEFPSIRPDIDSNFLKQFSSVHTFARSLDIHPKVLHVLPPFPWHIGIDNSTKNNPTRKYKCFDDFSFDKEIQKTKNISVISSNKNITTGHRLRLKFIDALRDNFGNEIDVFGRGINEFCDKWDVISPYKYHIVLENSYCQNGISEKLYDCYLGQAFPIYYGCPNVAEFFPDKSYLQIDIHNIDSSLQKIFNAVNNNYYEYSLPYIQEAKKLVLSQYNLFGYIKKYCEIFENSNSQKETIELMPEVSFEQNFIEKLKVIFKI